MKTYFNNLEKIKILTVFDFVDTTKKMIEIREQSRRNFFDFFKNIWIVLIYYFLIFFIN